MTPKTAKRETYTLILCERAGWVAKTDEVGVGRHDSDYDLKARQRRKVEKDKPDEEQPEEDACDVRRNHLSFEGPRGWLKFSASGEWLEKSGGWLMVGLTLAVAALATLAVAWKVGF